MCAARRPHTIGVFVQNRREMGVYLLKLKELLENRHSNMTLTHFNSARITYRSTESADVSVTIRLFPVYGQPLPFTLLSLDSAHVTVNNIEGALRTDIVEPMRAAGVHIFWYTNQSRFSHESYELAKTFESRLLPIDRHPLELLALTAAVHPSEALATCHCRTAVMQVLRESHVPGNPRAHMIDMRVGTCGYYETLASDMVATDVRAYVETGRSYHFCCVTRAVQDCPRVWFEEFQEFMRRALPGIAATARLVGVNTVCFPVAGTGGGEVRVQFVGDDQDMGALLHADTFYVNTSVLTQQSGDLIDTLLKTVGGMWRLIWICNLPVVDGAVRTLAARMPFVTVPPRATGANPTAGGPLPENIPNH